jgi:hypothetical protein
MVINLNNIVHWKSHFHYYYYYYYYRSDIIIKNKIEKT